MDDVELRLDLVAAHVVHGGDVLVEDQVFGGGWKPEKKQLCPDWSLNVNEIKKKTSVELPNLSIQLRY